MTMVYEDYIGGLGPSIDEEVKFLLTVRQSETGACVAVLVPAAADGDELRDLVVIGDQPIEIRLSSRGGLVRVSMERLPHITREQWVAGL